MSNYDILTLQTETAKRHIEFAIRNRIPKIVFIHGVGEGILKAELDFLLGRYDNIAFQDPFISTIQTRQGEILPKTQCNIIAIIYLCSPVLYIYISLW